MTIGTVFDDWPRLEVPGRPWDRCSPALVQLLSACRRRWGATSLGCYGVRSIRGGELPSTHSFGAAIDLQYDASQFPRVRDELVGYLVAWSGEWGVQAIHDYRGQRIWRAGRTPATEDACTQWWRVQRKSTEGMGQVWANWVHVEVTRAGWGDNTEESARGIT